MGKVVYMNQCQAEGCEKESHTRGYCWAHYQRLRKSGQLRMNTAVLAERGRKQDHPHYYRWTKFHTAHQLSPEWLNFWRFVDDVGDPGRKAKLQRLDASLPWGPSNFQWSEKLIGERKNAYYREWYKTGRKGREGRYRKAYGIGLDEYEAMEKAQKGLCALCETKGNGKRLAVDHDHETGVIRALLCQDCNTAIGLLKDDPQLMEEAAHYVRRHRKWKAA